MTQTLHPLFGEYINDQSVARAAAHRPGWTCRGVLQVTPNQAVPATWDLVLAPNPSAGFFAWRTSWNQNQGAFHIVEDASVVVARGLQPPALGQSVQVLVLGRWKWISGPVGSDGKPTGVMTEAMKAIYVAIPGASSVTPVDPVITPDTAGRSEVILARVVLESGALPVVEWIPETNLDLAEMGKRLAGKMDTAGPVTHLGPFSVDTAPSEPMNVVRKMDLSSLLSGEIVLGPGSTQNSGYALLGSLTLAWVRGPSTWFSGATNPIVNLTTPITFNTIYTYALSTENSEDASNIWDNDAWFQMVMGYGGNHFPVMCQCIGGNLGGYLRPVLWVLGTSVNHSLVISTGDWTGMAGLGQVYPKIITFRLDSTGGLGNTTWEVLSSTATASMVSGTTNFLQISFPDAGDFTVTIKATDSTGATATKTLNLHLNAYTQIPLIITAANTTRTTDTYPYNPSIFVSSSYTGGDPPITWSLVTGVNTTLPGATMDRGMFVSGSVSGPGTWSVELQATDSGSPTPQSVTKVFTITVQTYIPPPESYCFEGDTTFVLMEDGRGKRFSDLAPGERVMGILESSHEKGIRVLQSAMVTDLMRVPAQGGEPRSVLIHGVKATPGHAYATVEAGGKGGWTRAGELTGLSQLLTLRDQIPMAIAAGEIKRGSPVQVAMNLGNPLRTYFVGPAEEGPWILVHNIYYPSY